MKRIIIDEALLVLVNIVIIPHSGWDPNGPGNDTHWTTVLRNSSGILRYVKCLLLSNPLKRGLQSFRGEGVELGPPNSGVWGRVGGKGIQTDPKTIRIGRPSYGISVKFLVYLETVTFVQHFSDKFDRLFTFKFI